MIFAITKFGLGLSERVFIDGMGQDMRYTSKKLEYISLYIILFYILLEIPDFCLEYFFLV